MGKWDWRDDLDSTVVQGAEVDYAAPSAEWDDDWDRLVLNADLTGLSPLVKPTYTFGTMKGLWVGKMYVRMDFIYDSFNFVLSLTRSILHRCLTNRTISSSSRILNYRKVLASITLCWLFGLSICV